MGQVRSPNILDAATARAILDRLFAERADGKARSHANAIKVMREEEKGAFNPDLFNHFVAIINERHPA